MPIQLPPLSRRKFLAGSVVAAGISLAARGSLFAASPKQNVDPNRIALLSDTHIHADLAKLAREINVADHLRQTCSEILKLDALPAHVLINGDFAFNTGESADYTTAVELLKPVREANVPIHIALGNHDDRARFWAGVNGSRKPDAAMKDKHVALIETPHANWLLLDSQNGTNITRGQLGVEQLTWLAKTLDAYASKPALVMVHHNPEIGEAAGKNGGLADTPELLKLLSSHRNAKALFFGHSHRWTHEQRDDGLHLVNLPAVAYVFQPEQPSAWVDATIAKSDATLTLRCLKPDHDVQRQTVRLKWRDA